MAVAVKICGITRVEDGFAAARAGAHAIGLVFHQASPRFVEARTAAEIVRGLPPFVTAVGLFVDVPPRRVHEVLTAVPLGMLQFHGEEPPDYCAGFGLPYLKAVRVRREVDLLQYAARYATAKGLLLDAHDAALPGGTGLPFDWTLIPAGLPLPTVLAGGLTPDNVGEAVRRVRPWAVDVSTGVERAKGIKDADKMAAFVRGARDADG